MSALPAIVVTTRDPWSAALPLEVYEGGWIGATSAYTGGANDSVMLGRGVSAPLCVVAAGVVSYL